MRPDVERLLSGGASLLFPGAGQAAQGRWLAAALSLAAIVLTWFLATSWMAKSVVGIAGPPLAFLGVRIASGLEAFLASPRGRSPWLALLGTIPVSIAVQASALVMGFLFVCFALRAPPVLQDIGKWVVVDRRPGTLHQGDVVVVGVPGDRSRSMFDRVTAVRGGGQLETERAGTVSAADVVGRVSYGWGR